MTESATNPKQSRRRKKNKQQQHQQQQQQQQQQQAKKVATENIAAQQEVHAETTPQEEPGATGENAVQISVDAAPAVEITVDGSNLSMSPSTPTILKLKDKSQRRMSGKLDQLDSAAIQEALSKHDELQKEPSLEEVMGRRKVVTDAVKYILSNDRSGTDHLDLSKKGISNSGVLELAEALKQNDTITELDLSDNNFDDEAAVHLADLLDKNRTLMSLFLDKNFIRDRGTAALVEVLERNRTLTELTLNPVFSSDDDLDTVDYFLDRNYDMLERKMQEKEEVDKVPEEKPKKVPASVHRRVITYADELDVNASDEEEEFYE